ncbi:hypothetical protein [Conexibacter woesei]|uniref:hypothetical protein n=1 Tax=Conexibacter woesei TaxID=191495 RepID=UPI00041CD923|nr:hypothetical protein [Conexibacter woesei]
MAVKHWIRFAILVVPVGVVIGLVQHHRASRATVGKVTQAVFFDHRGADRVTVGGRAFHVSRHVVQGHPLIVAVASDTKGLNDGTVSRVSSRGRLQLSWTAAESGPVRARFVDAGGHQTVIVGDMTVATERAMSNLAARLAS